MRKSILSLILLVLLPALVPSVCFGAYVMSCDQTAASCSRAHVFDAFTALGGADGTVCIPEGDCIWGATDYPITIDSSKVNFCGEGKGITNIIRERYDSYSDIFYYQGYSGEATGWRVTGISFIGGTGGTVAELINIRNVREFRIDNCSFETTYRMSTPIHWKTAEKGLIYNCDFVNPNCCEGAVGGSYYGVTAGSPYYDDSETNVCPSERCDLEVCTCWVGNETNLMDESSSIASGNTVIGPIAATIDNLNARSPFNATGTVRRIYAWVNSVGSSPTMRVACFTRSGTVFTARDRNDTLLVPSVGHNIWSVDDGDFAAFDCDNGDYIGVYLDDCSLDISTGSTGWSMSGDQTQASGMDFGAADVGRVSISAELYDNDGAYGACEANWDYFYDDTGDDRNGYDGFDEDWKPSSDSHNAIYVEDCTWDWYKTSFETNWGSGANIVFRHNTLYGDGDIVSNAPAPLVGFKPGNQFAMVHDNVYTWGGTEQNGYPLRIRSNGLFYNNVMNNYNSGPQGNMLRHYSDFYFPYQVRAKRVYIYDNTYSNCACGTTDEDCFGGFNSCQTCAATGTGDNSNYHIRAPVPGELLYGFTEYVYPHPSTISGTTTTTCPSNTVCGTISDWEGELVDDKTIYIYGLDIIGTGASAYIADEAPDTSTSTSNGIFTLTYTTSGSKLVLFGTRTLHKTYTGIAGGYITNVQ